MLFYCLKPIQQLRWWPSISCLAMDLIVHWQCISFFNILKICLLELLELCFSSACLQRLYLVLCFWSDDLFRFQGIKKKLPINADAIFLLCFVVGTILSLSSQKKFCFYFFILSVLYSLPVHISSEQSCFSKIILKTQNSHKTRFWGWGSNASRFHNNLAYYEVILAILCSGNFLLFDDFQKFQISLKN